MQRKTWVWACILALFALLFSIARLTGLITIYRIKSGSMMPAYRIGGHIWASPLIKPTYNKIVCYQDEPAHSPKTDREIHIHRLVGLEGDTIEINDGYLLRNGEIADRPGHLMFRYYGIKKAIYDFGALKNLTVQPVFQGDTVFFDLTAREYKRLSRIVFLHKINPAQKNKVSNISGSTDKNCWNASNYGPIIVPRGCCFVLGDNRDQAFDSRYRGTIPLKNIVATAICDR